MIVKAFYSWQSDSPANTNRNFIEDALKQAIKELNITPEIIEAIRDEDGHSNIELDKDTKGIPGTPHIVDAILSKIENCGIFVADFSFIAETFEKLKKKRLVSNPNVLIEYSYAATKIGHSRIILIMNTAYGRPTKETLPFDMAHLRYPIPYHLPEDSSSDEKKKVKKELVRVLKSAIHDIIASKSLPQKTQDNSYLPLKPGKRISSFLEEGDVLGHIPADNWGEEVQSKVIWHDGPQMFLRIIPIEPLKDKTLAMLLRMAKGSLRPLGGEIGGVHRTWSATNKHGVVVFNAKAVEKQETAEHICQLTKHGELWAIDSFLLTYRNTIPGIDMENELSAALSGYLKFAKEVLEISAPITVMVGLTGVEEFKIAYPGRGPIGVCTQNDIIHEVKNVSPDINPLKILQPFFQEIWETCGVSRPEFLPVYDEELVASA